MHRRCTTHCKGFKWQVSPLVIRFLLLLLPSARGRPRHHPVTDSAPSIRCVDCCCVSEWYSYSSVVSTSITW